MKHLSRFDIEAIAVKYVQAYMALPDVRNTQIYRIDPELLLEKVLGLNVEYQHLSYDGSILGMTSFTEMGVQVFEDDDNEAFFFLDGKTVLVEKDLNFDSKLKGRKNFTLMHEGSHQIFKMLFPNDYGVTQKSAGVHYYKANSERNKPISDWEEYMQRKEIQRGDLFYYDFGKREGSVQSGERPVMVIQADNFNANAPTIIVAAVTAVMKKKYLPSHIILGEDFGLKKPSMVLLEQIQTVNKDELTDYIGSVNDERLWKQINAALKKTFGLWIYNTDRNGDVRCLCPKCLSDYIHDPNYVVRRLDPFAKSKDHCDKCNNSGWDYIVYDKRTSIKGKGCRNV